MVPPPPHPEPPGRPPPDRGLSLSERRHSGLGIASFATALVSGFAIIALIGTAAVMEAETPGGLDEESIEALTIGVLTLSFAFGELVAFGLGIGGLFDPGRRRVFAILGTAISGLVLAGLAVLISIGLAAE